MVGHRGGDNLTQIKARLSDVGIAALQISVPWTVGPLRDGWTPHKPFPHPGATSLASKAISFIAESFA